ncbi:hypothetical protein BDV98DRAFT_650534 [Pterulicium gracile]|uniref:Uncharacterized protein n=1 Tax=Pterulicium gracile TaxID=1884261 RepID=A0A5C3QFZ3_9AGAR|nr:hypothetical protein BDV98DRAFT_650534 [Pterula gracilis]
MTNLPTPPRTSIPPLAEGNDDDLTKLPVPFPTEGEGALTASNSTGETSNLTQSSSQQTHSDKLTELPSRSPGSASSPRVRAYNRAIQHSIEKSDVLPSALSDGDLPRNTSSVHPSRTSPSQLPPSRSDSASVLAGEAPRTRAQTSFTSFKRATSRTRRLSDPSSPSLAAMLRLGPSKQHEDSASLAPPPRASSQPHSRASSPLRVFQQWSNSLHNRPRGANREEPFIPINPFNFKFSFRFPFSSHTNPKESRHASCLPLPATTSRSTDPDLDGFVFFMTNTLPRTIYLLALLRIPSMYFSRVSRVFEDAEVSQPDIERIIDSFQRSTRFQVASFNSPANPTATGIGAAIGHSAQVGSAPLTNMVPLPFPEDWSPPLVSDALIRFRHSWEEFIDSLMREWKTLNLVSALLLSAILTIFQIPTPASDPLTRNFALVSLTCALMSLSYGCVYIVRFGAMRSMSRASRWAEEARKSNTVIWWNVWVMLAMPAIWLAWAMIWFITTILCFVWRSGSSSDPEEYPPISTKNALIPRIIISAVFVVGIVYFGLIVKTLRGYGTARSYGMQGRWMDEERVRNREGRARNGGGREEGYFSPGSSPRSAVFELADDLYERRGRGRGRTGRSGRVASPTMGMGAHASPTMGAYGSPTLTGGGLGRSPVHGSDKGPGLVSMQRDSEKMVAGLGISLGAGVEGG